MLHSLVDSASITSPVKFAQKGRIYLVICKSLHTFATREPPSLLTMLKSGVVLFYTPMTINFPKQYNSPEDLAALLSQRGLVFDDKERVCRYIRNIGYYRLSAYFYPFLEIPKDKQIFKQGSSFDAAIKLYRFDKKLRLFMFNEIEKIEVSLRSTLANVVAKETGNIFWMTDATLFSNPNCYLVFQSQQVQSHDGTDRQGVQ